MPIEEAKHEILVLGFDEQRVASGEEPVEGAAGNHDSPELGGTKTGAEAEGHKGFDPDGLRGGFGGPGAFSARLRRDCPKEDAAFHALAPHVPYPGAGVALDVVPAADLVAGSRAIDLGQVGRFCEAKEKGATLVGNAFSIG